LIDATADLAAAITHQIQYAVSIAAQAFPGEADKIKEIAGSSRTSLAKLYALYDVMDPIELQRELFWRRRECMYRVMALDIESGLFARPCGGHLVSALERSGYLASSHHDLMHEIQVPAILFSGRHSQCVGEKNILRAASQWRVPVRWFEESGHWPHIEQPSLFAEEVFSFFGA
jgi:pimeloyl-ACP methyl ester carboxylesterase